MVFYRPGRLAAACRQSLTVLTFLISTVTTSASPPAISPARWLMRRAGRRGLK